MAIVEIIGGRVRIQTSRKVVILGQEIPKTADKKELPPGELKFLVPLVREAFGELNLSGIEQQGYFTDLDPDQGRERKKLACARFARKGFSAHDVAELIITGNDRVQVALNLNSIKEENVQDYIDRLASEIVKYYPSGGKKK